MWQTWSICLSILPFFPHPQAHNSYIFTLQILHTRADAFCSYVLCYTASPSSSKHEQHGYCYIYRIYGIHIYAFLLYTLLCFRHLRGNHKMCTLANCSLMSCFVCLKLLQNRIRRHRSREILLSHSYSLFLFHIFFSHRQGAHSSKASLKSYSPRYPILMANPAHPHTHAYLQRYTQAKIKTSMHADWQAYPANTQGLHQIRKLTQGTFTYNLSFYTLDFYRHICIAFLSFNEIFT